MHILKGCKEDVNVIIAFIHHIVVHSSQELVFMSIALGGDRLDSFAKIICPAFWFHCLHGSLSHLWLSFCVLLILCIKLLLLFDGCFNARMQTCTAASAAHLLYQSAEAALPKQKRNLAITEFKHAMVAHKRRQKARQEERGDLILEIVSHI